MFAGSDAVVAAGGHVSLFDGRTGTLRWTRTGFGGGLAAVGSDVVVAPGAFRLDRRTGEIRTQYGPYAGHQIAASGNTVAVPGVVADPASGFTTSIELFDARSGRFLQSLRVDPPDQELVASIALHGPYVAIASESFESGGRLWAFAR